MNAVVYVVTLLLAVVCTTLLYGFVVMVLWNWLFPIPVTYWEAVGIYVLAGVLFRNRGRVQCTE